MTKRRSACPALFACCFLVYGCSGQASQTSKTSDPDTPSAKPSIVGKWITSTAPELAANATKMTFLESGECQVSGPLEINGQPAIAKIEGKEQRLPLNASGTWELKGDQLRVHLTQANVPGWKAEPWNYKLLELTDSKLVLEKERGDKFALFRVN